MSAREDRPPRVTLSEERAAEIVRALELDDGGEGAAALDLVLLCRALVYAPDETAAESLLFAIERELMPLSAGAREAFDRAVMERGRP